MFIFGNCKYEPTESVGFFLLYSQNWWGKETIAIWQKEIHFKQNFFNAHPEMERSWEKFEKISRTATIEKIVQGNFNDYPRF